MDLVLDLLATVSRWSRSNLSEIALALVGCLLVLFGSDVKGWLEQRVGSMAGALRIPIMALLCTVGSGLALIYATPWVVRGLSQFNNYSLAQHGATMAIHLGVNHLEKILVELLPHYGADCPIAVIHRATWPDQDWVVGTIISSAPIVPMLRVGMQPGTLCVTS